MKMPAQPLLRPPALVDEIVAMINQKLDLAADALVRPRSAQVGLAERTLEIHAGSWKSSSPAGFEQYFRELADLGGPLKASPEQFAQLV
jgi:hypothetical protein